MLERSRKWGHPVYNEAITVGRSYRGSKVSKLRAGDMGVDIYKREREREGQLNKDRKKRVQ